MRTDGLTDNDEANSRFSQNFAKAPKNLNIRVKLPYEPDVL